MKLTSFNWVRPRPKARLLGSATPPTHRTTAPSGSIGGPALILLPQVDYKSDRPTIDLFITTPLAPLVDMKTETFLLSASQSFDLLIFIFVIVSHGYNICNNHFIIKKFLEC